MNTVSFALRPLAFAISAAALTLSGSAWAMHETLVEISVPLERQSAFSVTPAEAEQILEKTPGGVTVVDAKTFQSGRTGNMDDTLKLATGVYIQSRFGSDEARVSIRGSGLQRTFHGRGLMLLQDGVPLNLADGGFDMQAVEPQATRYIEVERGANALRYGSSTFGGAINYVSKTGRTAPAMVLRAEAGSFDYQRYQLAVAGQQGNVDGYASFSHVEQDGFRDHARQRNGRFFGNVGFQLTPQIESRFYLTAVDTDSELPGNLTYAQLKADPRQATARSKARDQHRDFVLYRVANRTAITHDSGSVTEVTTFAAKKQLFHPIEFFPTGPGIIEQDNRDWGVGVRHSAKTAWVGKAQEHAIGVQWRHGLVLDERYGYANNVFVPGQGFAVGQQRGALDNRQKQLADNVELYGQSSWTWTPDLTTVVGVQSAMTKRKQTVLVDNIGVVNGGTLLPTASYQESYKRTSPKAGFIYRLPADAELYGNVSGSFEPPSFAETLSNKPLRAQRAVTTELGLRGNRHVENANWGWDITAYRAKLKNELLEVQVNPGQFATSNADKTVHQGVEAGVSVLANRWKAQASYLYNDFKFDRDAGFGNNTIAGVPAQVLAAEAAFKLPAGIWFGPTLRAASRSWVDHMNTLAAPGYTVLGLKLNQSLAHGIDWFVEGRNLTDKRYAATTGVVGNANGVDIAQFSPGEGRAVYVGVSKAF